MRQVSSCSLISQLYSRCTDLHTARFGLHQCAGAARVPVAVEADPHRIAQRQKQIDYGKNTLGYQRYTEEVPRYFEAVMMTLRVSCLAAHAQAAVLSW